MFDKAKFKCKVWQVIPCVCASLTCIPFGLMLGWPSPTYPKLIGTPTSPIPITMDQSALIAGFLMLGGSLGTLFSQKTIGPGTKYGIIMGNVLMVIGWTVMWQAKDIYALLGSRFLIGTGYGYGVGQIRIYIAEMSRATLGQTLMKHLNFYGLLGFVLAYAVGPWVDFRQLSYFSVIIAVFILFLTVFLPCTPKELLLAKKSAEAKKLLAFLKTDSDPEQEVHNLAQSILNPPESVGFSKIMQDGTLRVNFIKLTFLLFCQQYSGAPPTLVYTQIIFEKSQVPYPEVFAICYALLYVIGNVIGTYTVPMLNKKLVLLTSSCFILILLVANILVIYFRVNIEYFQYSSVITLYLFILVHTISLGSIPVMLINEWFPKSCKIFMSQYCFILSLLYALTATKTFQVLMTLYYLYTAFCLCLAVIIFAIFFIIICVPSEIPEKM
ncbi:solute carrier family 2, facilitated glucose transporter member 8-like [Anthonomus grandis grandis]|uniref:solute carrier family 2, facilitated glucose transporter member 8-like n=1 Tax=Anthonomus grandis grandis TaxID=2921223 RepID=UPI002166557B|nr:solute carrier family 2, facilitated glucose transporter member 8-like [Anthonomus grandis grandis]